MTCTESLQSLNLPDCYAIYWEQPKHQVSQLHNPDAIEAEVSAQLQMIRIMTRKLMNYIQIVLDWVSFISMTGKVPAKLTTIYYYHVMNQDMPCAFLPLVPFYMHWITEEGKWVSQKQMSFWIKPGHDVVLSWHNPMQLIHCLSKLLPGEYLQDRPSHLLANHLYVCTYQTKGVI